MSRRTERIGVGVLALATAVLYLWNLSASGWANSFYAAAMQAGSQSWKAFFFGSFDASNAITVDKPPLSLWPSALLIRVFGLSSWTVLVPQALMGVGSALLLYAIVRRIATSGATRPLTRSGFAAGLLAAAAFALTPVATLMFRFDNPDALLVLLLLAAVWATLRALKHASMRMLALAGLFVGLGFLTKTLQAFLVLPPLAVAYAAFAPTTWWKRVVHLLTAGVAMLAGLGWYVAIVEAWPADSRPYIGSTQTNSFLELAFGYNGLGRITGNETGAVVGGGATPGAGMWGETGPLRMFLGVSGGMVSWLIPAALLGAVVALVVLWRAPRTNLRRAALTVFALSLLTTAAAFSFMAGIYHDYYTVALTPYIAGTLGLAAWVLWEHRASLLARIGLAGSVAVTAIWAIVLLGQASGIYPALRWAVAVAALIAVVGLLLSHRRGRLLLGGTVAAGALTLLLGPTSYAVQTAATPHSGSIVTAGPVSGFGHGGPGGPGGMRGQSPGNPPPFAAGGAPGTGAMPGAAGGPGIAGGQGAAGGATGTTGTAPNGTAGTGTGSTAGQPPQGGTGMGAGDGRGGAAGGPGGGPGGLLDGAEVSAETAAALQLDSGSYRWVAAATGAQTAASYQLATGLPVMAIGGFNGSDPYPTLEIFQQMVADHEIHYYIPGGHGGPGGGSAGQSTSSAISEWVAANFTSVTVDGVQMYDLTSPSSDTA